MNIQEASKAMMEGKKVKRPDWSTHWYIKDLEDFKNVICSSASGERAYVSNQSIVANDFEVVGD